MQNQALDAERITKLLSEITTGSNRMSFKVSPEIPKYIEYLASRGGTIKDAIRSAAINFITSNIDAEWRNGIFSNSLSNVDKEADFDIWKSLVESHIPSIGKNPIFLYYYKNAYGTINNLKKSIGAASERGKNKITKTYVVSNGIKNFIDRNADKYGLNKSGLFEFLIRTDYSYRTRALLEEAKNFYGNYKSLLTHLESHANKLNDLEKFAHSLFRDHPLDGDEDLFYADLSLPGEYSSLRPISAATGNLAYLKTIMDNYVLPTMEDAVREAENTLKREGLNPKDYLRTGGEK